MISRLKRAFSDYGTVVALLLLCLYFSWAAYHQEGPVGREGALQLSEMRAHSAAASDQYIVVAQRDDTEVEFAKVLTKELLRRRLNVVATITGNPPEVRQALQSQRNAAAPGSFTVATSQACSMWQLWGALRDSDASYKGLRVVAPAATGRSAFLSASNLRNVVDQIAVIAIIAVGMTMVIISS